MQLASTIKGKKKGQTLLTAQFPQNNFLIRPFSEPSLQLSSCGTTQTLSVLCFRSARAVMGDVTRAQNEVNAS